MKNTLSTDSQDNTSNY